MPKSVRMSLLRLCLACLVLFATKSIAQAVTTEECQAGCSARQAAKESTCYSNCQFQCDVCNGGIRNNYYVNLGCFADATQSYCIDDGYCFCQCNPGPQ